MRTLGTYAFGFPTAIGPDISVHMKSEYFGGLNSSYNSPTTLGENSPATQLGLPVEIEGELVFDGINSTSMVRTRG